MVLQPVGRHSTAVYWRRRVVLLVFLVLIIVLLAKACSGGGTKTPTHNTAGDNPPAATHTHTPAPVIPCTRADLRATMSVKPATAPVGSNVDLVATVTNKTDTACLLTITPSNEIYNVSSGSYLVWTDAGCQAATAGISHKMTPGTPLALTVKWDTDKSVAHKCTAGDPAAAGTYHAQAQLGPITSPEATFVLS